MKIGCRLPLLVLQSFILTLRSVTWKFEGVLNLELFIMKSPSVPCVDRVSIVSIIYRCLNVYLKLLWKVTLYGSIFVSYVLHCRVWYTCEYYIVLYHILTIYCIKEFSLSSFWIVKKKKLIWWVMLHENEI